MKINAKHKELVRYKIRAYHHTCELMWDELKGDLEDETGLTEEQVQDLLDEVDQ